MSDLYLRQFHVLLGDFQQGKTEYAQYRNERSRLLQQIKDNIDSFDPDNDTLPIGTKVVFSENVVHQAEDDDTVAMPIEPASTSPGDSPVSLSPKLMPVSKTQLFLIALLLIVIALLVFVLMGGM